MKVSTRDSFQVVYSLYNHEYLGYIFESFIVKLDELGRLTLQHQNISSLNAKEFASGLDETDFELNTPAAYLEKRSSDGARGL